MKDQLKPQLFAAGATPEEAAAIAAVYEHLLRHSAPHMDPEPNPGHSPWKLAALEEGVTHQPTVGTFALQDLRGRRRNT